MHKRFAIFIYGAFSVIFSKFNAKAFLTPLLAAKTLRHQGKQFVDQFVGLRAFYSNYVDLVPRF